MFKLALQRLQLLLAADQRAQPPAAGTPSRAVTYSNRRF
jgi:hypothetical protein